MRTVRWPLRLGDIAAIVLAGGAIAVLLYAYLKHPEQQPASNFGPDWQCYGQAKGDASFCVKKSLVDPAKPAMEATAPN